MRLRYATFLVYIDTDLSTKALVPTVRASRRFREGVIALIALEFTKPCYVVRCEILPSQSAVKVVSCKRISYVLRILHSPLSEPRGKRGPVPLG